MTEDTKSNKTPTKPQPNRINVTPITAAKKQPGMGAMASKPALDSAPKKMKTATEAVAELAAVKTANAAKMKAEPKTVKSVKKPAAKKPTVKKRPVAATRKKQTQKKEIIKMTTEKTKTSKKNNKLLKDAVTDIKAVQNEIESAINTSSKSIEKVHQTIAKLPLKYLGKVEQIEKTAKNVREIQEKTIAHAYDLLRSFNGKVFDVSKDVVALADTK